MIDRQSADFAEWQEYFERHLGGRPLVFQMLLDGTISSMTMPEQMPQWFDPSFAARPGWKTNELKDVGYPFTEPRHRANVLVHKAAPQYEVMVALANNRADPLDWRWDDDGRGIWVSRAWIDRDKEQPMRQRLGPVARKVARA